MAKKKYSTGIGHHSTEDENKGYVLKEHLALQKKMNTRAVELRKYFEKLDKNKS